MPKIETLPKGPDYARALRVLMACRGVTSGEIAERVGVSHSAISYVATGQRTPSVNMLEAVCDAIHVPVLFFMLLAEGTSSRLVLSERCDAMLARGLLDIFLGTS